MTDIIYLDELKDAYDEIKRTSWILDNRMGDDYGEQAREDFERAWSEFDRLLEAYAAQEGVKDVPALRLAFQSYISRQEEIDERHRDRSDENLQRFYNDVGRLSEDDE